MNETIIECERKIGDIKAFLQNKYKSSVIGKKLEKVFSLLDTFLEFLIKAVKNRYVITDRFKMRINGLGYKIRSQENQYNVQCYGEYIEGGHINALSFVCIVSHLQDEYNDLATEILSGKFGSTFLERVDIIVDFLNKVQSDLIPITQKEIKAEIEKEIQFISSERDIASRFPDRGDLFPNIEAEGEAENPYEYEVVPYTLRKAWASMMRALQSDNTSNEIASALMLKLDENQRIVKEQAIERARRKKEIQAAKERFKQIQRVNKRVREEKKKIRELIFPNLEQTQREVIIELQVHYNSKAQLGISFAPFYQSSYERHMELSLNKEGTKVIDLSIFRYDNIPESIGKLTSLERFICNGFNKYFHLEQLTPSIGELKNLKRLYLLGHRLETIPVTLLQCKNLEYLDLSMNSKELLKSTVIKQLRENGVEVRLFSMLDFSKYICIDSEGYPTDDQYSGLSRIDYEGQEIMTDPEIQMDEEEKKKIIENLHLNRYDKLGWASAMEEARFRGWSLEYYLANLKKEAEINKVGRDPQIKEKYKKWLTPKDS